MSVSAAYAVHSVVSGANTFDEISNGRVSSEIEELIGRPAGFPHPTFRGIAFQRALATFDTPQLGTLAGLVSVAGADFSGAVTDLHVKSITPFGTRGTSGVRFRVQEALWFWSTLRASQGGVAQASVVVAANYDGTNEPIVPAGTSIAGTSVGTEWYTVGPCSVNGVAIPGVVDISVDSGLRLIQIGSDGDIFPTLTAIEMTEPSVRVTVLDAGVWTSLGLKGAATTSFSVFFRKKAAGGGNVANGTSQHVKVSGTTGYAVVEESAGGDNRPVGSTLRIGPTSEDEETLPLTLALAGIS